MDGGDSPASPSGNASPAIGGKLLKALERRVAELEAESARAN